MIWSSRELRLGRTIKAEYVAVEHQSMHLKKSALALTSKSLPRLPQLELFDSSHRADCYIVASDP